MLLQGVPDHQPVPLLELHQALCGIVQAREHALHLTPLTLSHTPATHMVSSDTHDQHPWELTAFNPEACVGNSSSSNSLQHLEDSMMSQSLDNLMASQNPTPTQSPVMSQFPVIRQNPVVHPNPMVPQHPVQQDMGSSSSCQDKVHATGGWTTPQLTFSNATNLKTPSVIRKPRHVHQRRTGKQYPHVFESQCLAQHLKPITTPTPSLDAALKALCDRNAMLQCVLAERDRQMDQLEDVLEERDRQVEQLTGALAERDKQMDKLKHVVKGLMQHLEQLHSSVSQKGPMIGALCPKCDVRPACPALSALHQLCKGVQELPGSCDACESVASGCHRG